MCRSLNFILFYIEIKCVEFRGEHCLQNVCTYIHIHIRVHTHICAGNILINSEHLSNQKKCMEAAAL